MLNSFFRPNIPNTYIYVTELPQSLSESGSCLYDDVLCYAYTLSRQRH